MNLPHDTIKFNDQLQLRQLQLSDADRIFGLVDTNRAYLLEYLPWVEHTKSVDDSRDFINHMLTSRQSGQEYGYGIVYEGQIIGHMSLMHLKDEKQPEIGYWVSADYKGKGITTDAATALTQFALEELKLAEVTIRAEQGNAGSNRVAEKCGYRMVETVEQEGRMMNIWKKLRP